MEIINRINTKDYISATLVGKDTIFVAEGIISSTGINYNCNITDENGDILKDNISSTFLRFLIVELESFYKNEFIKKS